MWATERGAFAETRTERYTLMAFLSHGWAELVSFVPSPRPSRVSSDQGELVPTWFGLHFFLLSWNLPPPYADECGRTNDLWGLMRPVITRWIPPHSSWDLHAWHVIPICDVFLSKVGQVFVVCMLSTHSDVYDLSKTTTKTSIWVLSVYIYQNYFIYSSIYSVVDLVTLHASKGEDPG